MITVDNLEVAQFIYLLLNNQKIRGIIDTITSKVVLILRSLHAKAEVFLGCAARRTSQEELLPCSVRFRETRSRDLTETVSTLAHLARFIIV